MATKNQIIRSNLRLVVSIAKRHVGPADNFFELVSDGNMSLMRAVEKFDYARGNKFSTYASWAIMKNFARTIPDEHRYHDRFRTSQPELFTSAEDDRTRPGRTGNGPKSARIAGRKDSRLPRRTGAEDHRPPFRPATRRRAADPQTGGCRVGRDERADPPDRSPGAQQTPQSGGRRKNRFPGVNFNCRRLSGPRNSLSSDLSIGYSIAPPGWAGFAACA